MGISPFVSQLVSGDTRYAERLAKLGRALVALSRDLAECRRDNARLERENAELRGRPSRLGRG
jgi:hypothetical protein